MSSQVWTLLAIRSSRATRGEEELRLDQPLAIDLAPLRQVRPCDLEGAVRLSPPSGPIAALRGYCPRRVHIDHGRTPHVDGIRPVCEWSRHALPVLLAAGSLSAGRRDDVLLSRRVSLS